MWFINKDSMLEKQLVEMYATMKSSLLGISKREAEKMASDMLMVAKKRMKESKQDKLPPNFGNFLLEQERKDPTCMMIKRQEGVQDEDILWLWNMHPLERCMMEVDDENARLAAFMKFCQEGMSSEDAAGKVKKLHPFYGVPEGTKHTNGDDRHLPPELKDRINKWINKHMRNQELFKNKLQQYSTMNAFIRAEIRSGNI